MDLVEEVLTFFPDGLGLDMKFLHPSSGLCPQALDLFVQALNSFCRFRARPAEDFLGLRVCAGKGSLGVRVCAGEDLVCLCPRAGDGVTSIVIRLGRDLRRPNFCRPRSGRDFLRLGLRASKEVFRFFAGAGRDLLRGFARLLKERFRLLANPVERVPDCRLRRPSYFELRNQAVDLIDIRVDRPAFVPTGRTRERDVADRGGHARSTLNEAIVVGRS